MSQEYAYALYECRVFDEALGGEEAIAGRCIDSALLGITSSQARMDRKVSLRLDPSGLIRCRTSNGGCTASDERFYDFDRERKKGSLS